MAEMMVTGELRTPIVAIRNGGVIAALVAIGSTRKVTLLAVGIRPATHIIHFGVVSELVDLRVRLLLLRRRKSIRDIVVILMPQKDVYLVGIRELLPIL